MYSSVIFEYRQTSNTPGTRDGTVKLANSLAIPQGDTLKGVRLMKAVISKQIPNIYSYLGFDNTKIRVSTNGGALWTILQLTPGIYTVPYLNSAINAGIASLNWLSNVANPCLNLNYNPATGLVYLEIDSTKLIAGQFGISFTLGNIAETLGFGAVKTFVADGLYSADLQPQMDSQGTMITVQLNDLCSTLRIDPSGASNNTLCVIPIDSNNPNEIIFEPRISPIIQTTLPPHIHQYSIKFINGLGRPMYLITGNVLVEFEVIIAR